MKAKQVQGAHSCCSHEGAAHTLKLIVKNQIQESLSVEHG